MNLFSVRSFYSRYEKELICTCILFYIDYYKSNEHPDVDVPLMLDYFDVLYSRFCNYVPASDIFLDLEDIKFLSSIMYVAFERGSVSPLYYKAFNSVTRNLFLLLSDYISQVYE